jgi:hypothetical protein
MAVDSALCPEGAVVKPLWSGSGLGAVLVLELNLDLGHRCLALLPDVHVELDLRSAGSPVLSLAANGGVVRCVRCQQTIEAQPLRFCAPRTVVWMRANPDDGSTVDLPRLEQSFVAPGILTVGVLTRPVEFSGSLVASDSAAMLSMTMSGGLFGSDLTSRPTALTRTRAVLHSSAVLMPAVVP